MSRPANRADARSANRADARPASCRTDTGPVAWAALRCGFENRPPAGIVAAVPPASPKTALVLVDHGSRSDRANASLEDVARQVAALAGDRFVAVLAAHMEIAAPSVADAFDAAVAAGAEVVVVVLYFLAPGRHSESDVPRLAAEAAARHPGIGYSVTRPLGPDPALSALALARATEAIDAHDS
jgi:hypothetical protein